jgi:hypothetical protein
MPVKLQEIEKQISELSLEDQLYLMEKLARNVREKTSQIIEKETSFQGLGGLWKGVEFSEEDIAEARREMWGTFGEKEI